MGNIFNDINKLVNTVQKADKIVDKLFTEKPKSETKQIRLSKKDLLILREWYTLANPILTNKINNITELNCHNKLYDKLMKLKNNFN